MYFFKCHYNIIASTVYVYYFSGYVYTTVAEGYILHTASCESAGGCSIPDDFLGIFVPLNFFVFGDIIPDIIPDIRVLYVISYPIS